MRDFDNFNVNVTDDGIASRLAIDSQAAMNSLSDGMTEELLWLATELDEDESIRCIVLRGSDGVFCAGGNISSFEEDSSAAGRLRRGASMINDVAVQLKRGETPLVTGIDGPAVGAGFSIALLGDITLMHEDAYLQFGYSRIGLTGDGSATFYLPHHVGLQEAKRIAYSIRRSLQRKQRTSVSSRRSQPTTNSKRDSRNSAKRSRPVRRKHSVRYLECWRRSYARQLPDQLAEETEQIANASKTADYVEGVTAFKEKREPSFEGQ